MVMITSGVGADQYNDCIFEVLTDPYEICGSKVVKMICHETGKYFAGGYAIDFLRKVGSNG